MREKLKSLIASDQVFYSLLVILVGLGGFLLGGGEIITKPAEVTTEAGAAAIVTTPVATVAAAPTPAMVSPGAAGVVVGSKSGTKYHLPTCPGASQIKPENRIEFASVELALAAGYKPAANCPGLVQ
jgi:hypothetical protein